MKHFKIILFNSFLNYLPEKERNIITSFEKGLVKDPQPIIDILTESKIFTMPTPDNIRQLCLKCGKIILLSNSYLSVKSIVNGMGPFWTTVTSDMIDSIFLTSKPTAEKVIKALQPEVLHAVDDNIVTWLHRYLRVASDNQIQLFMRFITGAITLYPTDIIKVQFVDMSLNHLRPMAETCFKILTLPRGFLSLSQFRAVLDRYLKNVDAWNLHDE